MRTLYAMVNEGALTLEGGFAQRASDIDVVWLYGYGWPRHTGGPMFWAKQIGDEMNEARRRETWVYVMQALRTKLIGFR